MTSTTVGIDRAALLETAQGMGALPVTVSQLVRLVADDDYEIRDLVGIVSLDQSLMASLLRQANSAASAPVAPVTTIRDAAVRLGVSSLLSMALAATVSDKMNAALPGYAMSEGDLWRESVAASVAADVLRVKASVEVPVEAGTAALLHDLGKVVLSAHLGTQVLEVLGRTAAETDGQKLLEAEDATLGVNHVEVGAMVAEQWQLPATIVEAIRCHHELGTDLSPVSATVSVAHAMVPQVLSPDELVSPIVPMAHRGLVRRLGIDPGTYPAVLATVRARYAELAERYGVD